MKFERKSLLVTLGVLVASVFLSPVWAEESDLENALKAFDKSLKEKDTKALTTHVDGMLELFLNNKIEEGEYKKVSDRLSKAFATNRNEVQIRAAQMLGNLGKPGATVLLKVFMDRKLQKDEKIQVYYAVIRGLGLTQDVRAMKVLLKLLKNKSNVVIVAGAEALANFSEAKGVVRKEIAGEMIKLLASAASGAQDPRKTAQVEKYNVISAPFNNTLQALTSASPGNAQAWQKWFNDNKKRRW